MVQRWWSELRETLRQVPTPVQRASLLLILGAAAIGGVAVMRAGEGTPPEGADSPAPPVLSVAPEGDDVPRLAPVVVGFPTPPPERDGAHLISLEPATEGDYAWIDDRTLLFQPAFPGLRRGATYAVRVNGAAAGLEQDEVRSFTVEGKLAVSTTIPADGDEDVPEAAQVLVQFTRSVAPLTLLSSQDDQPVLEFDPPLAGAGEWLNTSLYRFTPNDLRPSTTYRVRIAAGLSSAVDGVLEEDFTWSFSTYRPQLTVSDPSPNTQFVGLRRPVVLTFNQPMDRESVAAGLRVVDPSGAALAGELEWTEDDAVVTFTPSEPYELETRYEVRLDAGLRGRFGGATPAERSFDFVTVGLPRVVRTEPADGISTGNRWGVRIEFNNPMDIDSLEERLTISGIDADELRFYSWDERSVDVQVGLEPSAEYTVAIADGVVDRDGLPLGPYSFSFSTAPLSPQFSFAAPGELASFSSDAEHRLYFHAVNMPSVRLTLYPVTESEAVNILQLGYFPDRPDVRWMPSSPSLRTWEIPLEEESGTLQLGSTLLADEGSLPVGHYLVSSSNGQRLLVSVVDTAIVTKLALDELLVWVLDPRSGEPLSGVELTAHGFPGGEMTATTDGRGIASLDVPRPRDVDEQNVWMQRTFVIRIDGGGRFGVSSFGWSQGAQPWDLSIPYSPDSREYVAHLYTDRPIHRPGETLSLKGVVRLDDDATYSLPDPARPLHALIQDAEGERIWEQDVTVNDFGTFAAELELPAEAAIGGYVLALRHRDAEQWDWITATSFRVAEFRRPEFEVTVEPETSDVIDGDTITALAGARFYFGGGVPGARVSWTALSEPGGIFAEGYEGYSFRDWDYWRTSAPEDPLRAQGETVTAEDGTAVVEVPANLRGSEGTQRYQISVTVTDQNEQAVASSAAVTVHPAAVYAGIRTTEYIGREGEPMGIAVVSVDTQGAPLPNREVAVRVYEREWVTTKERTAGGARRYRSEPRDTLVATLSAVTDDAAEATLSYTPENAGTLRLVAEAVDDRGRVAESATFAWVSGQARVPWRITNDDTIELVADRDEYAVGDVAEILVPAPFEFASGLVTVERGRIMTRSVQRFETSSEVLRVPIEDAHVPNVFVGVVLYRPPTEDDPIARYKVGYVRLPVSTEARALDVRLTPDRERALPGETVSYDIRVTGPDGEPRRAEFSISIVDKAVLALTEELSIDGMRAFWYERPLSVSTASSLSVAIDRTNDVIQEPSEGGKGGGGEPRLRESLRNSAYWEAQVVTDGEGRATVEVLMPDNLTTWRAQVRAVSGDTMVGEAVHELLVTQPMLIRPALPRFLRVGDETQLRVLLRNATDEPREATLTLEAEGVEIAGPATRTVTVPAESSSMLEWPATVDAEGTARLVFRASGGDLGDAIAVELPVYLDVTPETTATGGVVTGNAGAEAIYLPEYAIREGGRLEVGLQASITGVLADELPALRPLPNETVDRTSSRLLATLAVRRAYGEPAAADRSAQDAVTRLLATRRADGGWAWCWTCRSDERMTAMALVALAEARMSGLDVPSEVFSRGAGFLSGGISRRTDVEAPADQAQRAYLVYASLLGKRASGEEGPLYDVSRELSTMRSIFEQYRETIANWGRAYVLLGLLAGGAEPDDHDVRALLNDLAARTVASANGNHWEDEQAGRWLHSNLRTTALVLRALVAAEPRHPLVEETTRWLVTARSARGWETSVSRAQAIDALGGYAAHTGELLGDFGYTARFQDETIEEGRFAPREGQDRANALVPLTDVPLGEVSVLSLTRDRGPGRLYYALNLRYLTPASEIEAMSRGFAVSHEYSVLGGPEQRVERVALGDVVRVRVTVVAPADRKFVVVDDYLPAGLEPIDPQLATVGEDLKRQLEREQREAARGDADIGYAAPWYRWYYSPWQQVDTRDDRVTLRADELPKGVHEYVYYARATTPGSFFLAPAHAEEAFFPEVFGRSDSGHFEVTATDSR